MAAESASSAAGAVLFPSHPDSDWWDRKTLSGPVVVKQQLQQTPFKMFYYGRGGDEWNFGVKPFSSFLPTGRIGMATSRDGLSFERVRGAQPGGAIMDPSEDPAAFDAVHIGVGDVIEREGGELWMYYLGGGMEELPLVGSSSGKLFRGVKLQTGLAISRDGGLSFERAAGGEPILRVGDECDWDRNGVSWPRVIQDRSSSRWIMTYHTRESGGPGGLGFFSAGVATSIDGVSWDKGGKILGPGSPGSWDEGGVSVRHVIQLDDGSFAMLYEGSNYALEFCIGLATSADGISWSKDEQCGEEPGGPILRARRQEQDAWDNGIVGTPYVLKVDGSLRLYYLGLSRAGVPGIGVATAAANDIRKWSRAKINSN